MTEDPTICSKKPTMEGQNPQMENQGQRKVHVGTNANPRYIGNVVEGMVEEETKQGDASSGSNKATLWNDGGMLHDGNQPDDATPDSTNRESVRSQYIQDCHR
jgi:hypothetical protein